MAIVFIPPMMQKYTGGVESVQIEGRTLREIVEGLEARFPGTKRWLVEGDRLRPGVAAAINGEQALMGLLEPVGPDDEVHFIPALSGGL